MNNVTEISCVRSPRRRALFIGKDFHKRIVVNCCTVATHFKPKVEQVVLLIGFFRALLDFFQFQIVAAFLANLGDRHNAKLKTSCVRVVFNHLFPKSQNIKVQNVSVTRRTFFLSEEIVGPHGKVALVYQQIIFAD